MSLQRLHGRLDVFNLRGAFVTNQSGAPPAYEVVINRPEDYPVYQSAGK